MPFPSNIKVTAKSTETNLYDQQKCVHMWLPSKALRSCHLNLITIMINIIKVILFISNKVMLWGVILFEM